MFPIPLPRTNFQRAQSTRKNLQCLELFQKKFQGLELLEKAGVEPGPPRGATFTERACLCVKARRQALLLPGTGRVDGSNVAKAGSEAAAPPVWTPLCFNKNRAFGER